MKTRFHSSTLLAVLAISALGAADVHAAGKSMIASKDAIPQTDGAPIGILATVFSTGFEAGYALGPVEPQNGWTASGTNLPWASISAAEPCEGSLHIRLINDPTVGPGLNRVLLTPAIVQPANAPSQVKVQLNLSNWDGADYDVVGQAPSQGFLSWRVKFHFDDTLGGPGMIFVLDDLGAGLQYIGTGVTWLENSCAELKVQFDPANGETRYFYNGLHIYSSAIYAGTSIEQLVFLHDNFQLPGETGEIDAINWIDTPSDPVPVTNASWGKIKNTYR